MEDGGADADERGGEEEPSEGGSDGEEEQAGEGEGHADGQSEGARGAVSEMADEGLEERGGDLVGEGEEADLGEVEVEGGFEDGIDGGQERLHHVVEEVAEAGGGEDAEECAGLGGGSGCDGFEGWCLAHGLRVTLGCTHAYLYRFFLCCVCADPCYEPVVGAVEEPWQIYTRRSSSNSELDIQAQKKEVFCQCNLTSMIG